jgi:glycosyltransferase involved in cell wall biosynthesis
MNLLVVTPRLAEHDGQGQVNIEILRTWLARGHSATAVTRDVAPDLLASPRFTWVDAGIAKIPSELIRRRILAASGGRYVSRNRDAFDLVVVDGATTLSYSDVNCAHFVHGALADVADLLPTRRLTFRSAYHALLNKVEAGRELAAFRRAGHVVAVSAGVRDQLARIGVDARSISVIWNGIDGNEFHPGPESRTALGITSTGFVGLFAGDIKSSRKNLDTVLSALKATPAVNLVVAGATKRSPYPRMVQKMGLADRVQFLGFRPDIASVMRAVDAFVYPAIYEPLGLVVLEAMASGLPVITAKTTGAAALITDAAGYVLDDPRDVPGLSRALAELVADPERRRRMGAAGREIAGLYTRERMSQEYVALYERLAKSGGTN